MVAAIAIANDLPVHTCNPWDFTGIEGPTVVAVPHPDHCEPKPNRTLFSKCSSTALLELCMGGFTRFELRA